MFRFIDHFNTQLVITLNYSAVVDFHILPVTPAGVKSSLDVLDFFLSR
jgi:hypothetical protein